MKKLLIIIIVFLFSNIFTENSNSGLIDKTNLSKIVKIDTNLKGKKLREFFTNNEITINFDNIIKKYKFFKKKYEVYTDDAIIEEGTWKTSGGILKNNIKLKVNNNSKVYFIKKPKKGKKIYFYNKLPGKKDAEEKIFEIINSAKQLIAEDENNKKENNNTIVKSKKSKKKPKKKKKEKKKSKNDSDNNSKKYKYIELTQSQINKLKNYEKESKKLKIINSNINSIQLTKQHKQAGQFLASQHCAKNNQFAFSFKDSGYGNWYASGKRAKYFLCSKNAIFVNPKTGKEVRWTNYEDEKLFKFPSDHLFLHRKLTRTYNRLIEEKKKKNPRIFKKKYFNVVYKDENSIHIIGELGTDNMRERTIANEHCSKHNKKYYFFEDSYQQGMFGTMLFHCSSSYIASNPMTDGLLIYTTSGNENYSSSNSSNSSGQNNLSNSQMQAYNSSSYTTYYFFESSHNLMSALELLYRAYDQNLEADKLKAQIEYNRESKYSEADKLNSTRSIIDVSSKKITANINDASQVLSDIGRGYYEQSLPYAYSATQNAILLAMTIKNTVEKSSEGTESLFQNLGEVVGFFTILKDLPQFAKDMQSTSKLIFGGAKAKKIRDKGNHGKALEELNLN